MQLCAAIAEKEKLTAQAADSAHQAATTTRRAFPKTTRTPARSNPSYLAGAQAARARELKGVQNALIFVPLRDFAAGDAIGLTALVSLHDANATRWYWLMPYGGGMRIRAQGTDIAVVTPEAALGQALVGLRVGDALTVAGRDYEVITVT